MGQPSYSPTRIWSAYVEELGIHYGNGSLFHDRKWGKAGFDIYGDLYDDFPYLEFYVSKLIEFAYGVEPKTYVHPRSATLILRALSRHALTTKENAGIRPGRKIRLRLPRFLRSCGNDAVTTFIRGLVDIEGSLRFRKQHRNRHYYPVLECEMGDPSFVRSVYALLTKIGVPVVFRNRVQPPKHANRRSKASFYCSGWNGMNAWLRKVGLTNAKHISKLLVAQRNGFCPPHSSLDERLAIIAGELDPESFYHGRIGDAIAVPRYRFAHELMTLRILSRPQIRGELVGRMKVRGALTQTVLSKLLKAHEVRQYQAKTGTAVEITELGYERLQNLYSAWKELGSKYSIAIPASPDYCPEAYRQKSVN
jgi:hypothetical protein